MLSVVSYQEIQISIPAREHLIPTDGHGHRRVTSVGEDVEQPEASRTAGGKVKRSGHCGKQSSSPPALCTAKPRNPMPRYPRKRTENAHPHALTAACLITTKTEPSEAVSW